MNINKILDLYPTGKEIDVICIKNGTMNELHGLKFGKRYKASLINSFHLPLFGSIAYTASLHWEVNDTICALEYLIPIEEWRNNQIDKIVK